MKKLSLLIFSLAFVVTGNAQTSDLKPGTHSLGLHAGASTGLGLSYRYWPSRFGLQVTGIPVFEQGGGHFISAGLTGLYEIRQGDLVDFYGYWGNHLISEKNIYSYWDYSAGGDPIITEMVNTSTQYNIGLGIGFRCHIAKVVDFELQGGYGIFDVGNDIYTFPTGEIGLYYRL